MHSCTKSHLLRHCKIVRSVDFDLKSEAEAIHMLGMLYINVARNCGYVQSAISGGAIKGSAFWLLLAPGQTAPLSDGGRGALYGIYNSDSTFQYIASNAQAGSDHCAQTVLT